MVLLGKKAKTLLKKLSVLLAEKWEKPYSQVCGYVPSLEPSIYASAEDLVFRQAN
jgi:hypothetical protein